MVATDGQQRIDNEGKETAVVHVAPAISHTATTNSFTSEECEDTAAEIYFTALSNCLNVQ